MIQYNSLVKKWEKVLEYEGLPSISESWKKTVTAVLLENQSKDLESSRRQQTLSEATPTNVAGGIDNFDPVLLTMVRRAAPNLIAYDVCGVQPMTGPTGLIFALRSRYTSQSGTEALFNEANTAFAGTGTHSGTDVATSWSNGTVRYGSASANGAVGRGLSTAAGEGDITAKMAFDIDKVQVTAKTRNLTSGYSHELAQDLKAIHGADAASEVGNILSNEILAEINREVVRTINIVAKAGCATGTTTVGTFDLDTDSNGRWSVEKFKGLLFRIEQEANTIARQTRRGKGNIVICSSDVASALAMAGVLDYAPALQSNTNLNVDDTGNTFAGVISGRIKVFIDPYFESVTGGTNYATIGFKGTIPYDAGLFYCPYVPLQVVNAIDPDSFQPRVAFKTRYGLVENPFVTDPSSGSATLTQNRNQYYRVFNISNLM